MGRDPILELFPRPAPVDWFRLLADLDYSGRCNASVAQVLAMAVSTLRHCKDGGQPNHSNGEALCLYYTTTLNKPVPRIEIPSTVSPANLYA